MKACTSLLALLVLAGPAGTAEMDKSKLRQLAKLPAVACSFNFGIGFSHNGFRFNDEKPDPLVKIAQIRRELKGDATDAERYLRIGCLYNAEKRTADAKDAKTRAVSLFRQQVKEHPHDMRRLAQLGDALFSNGEAKESETLLRRAVKEAPNDWQIWGLLGACLDGQATWAILGHQYFDFHWPYEGTISPAIFEKTPKTEQIAEWRRLQKEARCCYDRAIELAPRETEPYCWRAVSLMTHEIFEIGLRRVQGEQVPMNIWARFLTPAFAADARQIARLSPNDPKSIGGAVMVELGVCMAQDKSKAGDPVVSFEDRLPEPSRDFVHWGRHRLEEMTKSTDKSTAAAASEVLANVLMVIIMGDGQQCYKQFGELPEGSQPKFKDGLCAVMIGVKALAYIGQIEQHLRRAVQLEPTRDHAWDLLIGKFTETGEFAEAAAVCEQRLKTKDNAHNRFLLANCYTEQRKYDKAAEQLRAGIAKDENDLNCRLGLAAVLLRQDDVEALAQAGEQLDDLAPRIKQAKSKSRTRQYQLLRGLHSALSDQSGQAKEMFQDLLRQVLNNRTAVEALIALGIPATPADESLAIAYFQAHKAEIQRKNKQPDSPVVKVCLAKDDAADEDLYLLSAFSKLRNLRLSGGSITDAGLAHFDRLATLRRLELNCSEITDAGLTHLHKLKRLEHVNLRGTKVTEKGIAELRKVFPKLDILR